MTSYFGGGGGGGDASRVANCGSCPAGVQLVMPALQSSVPALTCPPAIPSAICAEVNGPLVSPPTATCQASPGSGGGAATAPAPARPRFCAIWLAMPNPIPSPTP